MIDKIVIFDFDGTLFHTPEPKSGEVIWKKSTGMDWPYTGWWSKKETLDTDIFNIPLNQFVYRKYLEAVTEENTFVGLATGRIERLRKEVEKILRENNLEFDIVALNKGGDTLTFKKRLFEKLIQEYKPHTLTMYDDRLEHIVEFEVWAKTQPCTIEIIDVTKSDKTPKIINPKK